MCLAPIKIKNTHFGKIRADPAYNFINDVYHEYIEVPCGCCATCIHLKQVYLIQRVQMEAVSHDLFYGTLTYNNESLPVSKYSDIKFAHVDFTDWQKMIKMIRRHHPELNFRYMLVSEYGGKKHRPHFHFILSLPRDDTTLACRISRAERLFKIFLKYWRRNIAPPVWSEKRQKYIPNSWHPQWQKLLTYHRVKTAQGWKYNYDLHWLDPNSSKDGLDGVAFYVTKYIMKFDEWVDKFKSILFFNLSEDDYKDAWSKFKPRILLSKFFGAPDDPAVVSHIVKGINVALANQEAFYPFFVSRVDGSTYPLAPYYSKRFLRIESQLEFIRRRPYRILTETDFQNFDNQQKRLSDSRILLRSNLTDFDYDFTDINSTIYGIPEKASPVADEFAASWEDY